MTPTFNFDAFMVDALKEVRRRKERKLTASSIWRHDYKFYGANQMLWELTSDHVILIVGPAECGKTIATCCLLHYLCLANPGVRCAIIRKEQTSMQSTIVRTFEDKVLPEDRISYFNETPIRVTPYGGSHPTSYLYSNKSIIFLLGMDKSMKRLGGEIDFALYNQAEQSSVEDIETLMTRTTGRSGKIKTRRAQLILDANPGGSDHHLLQMISEGRAVRIDAKHEDNPTLYDHEKNEWTDQGRSTLATLDKLTGVRYQRLRKGVWAGAEGSIFPEFDEKVHGIDFVEIQDDWQIILTLDFGFNHPNVWMLHAIDNDGNVYTIWEMIHRFHFVKEVSSDLKEKIQATGFQLDRIYDIRAGGDAFARTGTSEETIAEQYESYGIRLHRGEVGPGSRLGKTLYFQELLGVSERKIPPKWFYVKKGCPTLARQIPSMIPDPKAPDTMKKIDIDANGKGGDDCVDSLLLIWQPYTSSMA